VGTDVPSIVLMLKCWRQLTPSTANKTKLGLLDMGKTAN